MYRGLLAFVQAGCVVAWISAPLSAQVAAPWPQFRGPDGQGNAGEVTLRRRWSEADGIVWKTALPGLGHSSPVHDGSLIWVTAAPREGRSLRALAIDPRNGTLLHDVEVFAPRQVEDIHTDNSHASPTAVLHEGRVFVHFGTYGTACIDVQTAEIAWRNNEYQTRHDGGPGSSPVLFEDLLIITLDGADSQRVVALDSRTGQMRWEQRRSAPMPENPTTHRAFSTPLLAAFEGRPILVSPAANQCHAYDPRTGEELWHVRYTGFSTVPRPVANADTCFVCTGFFNPELWSISLAGQGDVTSTHVRWRFKGQVPETPSPLLIDQTLYLVSDLGVLTALNAEDGSRKWTLRLGGNYSASPLYARGLIYFCSEEGIVKVVDPHLPKPRVVEISKLEGRIMASPAVLGNDLLIRTHAALYRIGDPLLPE